jgi:glutamate synthase domain-containing protein 3
MCRPALEDGEPVAATLPIRNVNRVVGTILGSEITRRYGANGLPEDTIRLRFVGSAGQSFGAFIPQGLTLVLEGDSMIASARAYRAARSSSTRRKILCLAEKIIIGNDLATTSSRLYIRVPGNASRAQQRRHAVVEGVGDHDLRICDRQARGGIGPTMQLCRDTGDRRFGLKGISPAATRIFFENWQTMRLPRSRG